MWLDVLCERLPFSAFDRNTTNFDYIISFLGYISEERSFGKNFIGHHCWKPLNIFSFLISCKTYVCLCYLSIPIFFLSGTNVWDRDFFFIVQNSKHSYISSLFFESGFFSSCCLLLYSCLFWLYLFLWYFLPFVLWGFLFVIFIEWQCSSRVFYLRSKSLLCRHQ